MTRQGWDVTLIDDSDVVGYAARVSSTEYGKYKDHLRLFLQHFSRDFDVVEYDHVYLPFPRTEFSPHTLMVARSVLLGLHQGISYPKFRRLRDRLRALVTTPQSDLWGSVTRNEAWRTIEQSDLVNVSNTRDAVPLRTLGLPDKRILIQPYAIAQESRAAYNAINLTSERVPSVVFLGSFDSRKGGPDLPFIFESVASALPHTTFHLFGAAGQFQTELAVRSCFPRKLQENLFITMQFNPSILPSMLAPLSVGVFPSYLEGFGLAVVEQLAAGIPVVAYDSPGPSDILPKDWLAERGDYFTLAKKLSKLLTERQGLTLARKIAHQYSERFDWDRIGAETSIAYQRRSP